MQVLYVHLCLCVRMFVCVSVHTHVPASLTHCHHRPVGKPPPTHSLKCSRRSGVRACVYTGTDVNKIGLVERLNGLVLVCAQG